MTTTPAVAPLSPADAAIIEKQVADWRREVSRLQDLITHATGAPAVAPLSADELDKPDALTGAEIANIESLKGERFYLAEDVERLIAQARAAQQAPQAVVGDLPPLPDMPRSMLEHTAWGPLFDRMCMHQYAVRYADLAIAADRAQQAGAAAPSDLLNTEELAALRRFDECSQDGEGYDVPKEMMQRLAAIGVVQRRSGAYYQATDFGQRVLGNAPAPATPQGQGVGTPRVDALMATQPAPSMSEQDRIICDAEAIIDSTMIFRRSAEGKAVCLLLKKLRATLDHSASPAQASAAPADDPNLPALPEGARAGDLDPDAIVYTDEQVIAFGIAAQAICLGVVSNLRRWELNQERNVMEVTERGPFIWVGDLAALGQARAAVPVAWSYECL